VLSAKFSLRRQILCRSPEVIEEKCGPHTICVAAEHGRTDKNKKVQRVCKMTKSEAFPEVQTTHDLCDRRS